MPWEEPTIMIKGIENRSFEASLRNWVCLFWRGAGEGVTQLSSSAWRVSIRRTLSRSPDAQRTKRGSRLTSFKENCVKHWNWLSRDVMESPFLKIFKKRAAAADGYLLRSLNVWPHESGRQTCGPCSFFPPLWYDFLTFIVTYQTYPWYFIGKPLTKR